MDCVSRTEFVLLLSLFAARICQNRIRGDRKAHGTKAVPWLPPTTRQNPVR
jgi:hypothetical protein